MKTLTDLALIVVAGIITVALLTAAVSVASTNAPAKPAVYFPPLGVHPGPHRIADHRRPGRAGGLLCLQGPEPVDPVSTVAALSLPSSASRSGGSSGPATGLSDFIRQYLDSVNVGSGDLVFLLVVYGLAGAIGGIVDYFLSQGRKCDINQQR